MSMNQHPYATLDTPLAVTGAGTFNSVGITPANRPLEDLSVELELGTPANTQDFDAIVQTAPAGVAAGGIWNDCGSSVVRMHTTTGRVLIRVRDPILAQVRLRVVQRGTGTFTGNIRWCASRNLVTVES